MLEENRRKVQEAQMREALEQQRREEERYRELEELQRQKKEAMRRKKQQEEEERTNQTKVLVTTKAIPVKPYDTFNRTKTKIFLSSSARNFNDEWVVPPSRVTDSLIQAPETSRKRRRPAEADDSDRPRKIRKIDRVGDE
ncbi:hypothetical protein TEA_007154 [Camellia sinensis var. sinensis]|uniref:Uncharacterized protein n=1 Tax=Camellia sinensis var. sinensis TaxID=542762 RepID=A0A4V3WIY7_CAMSN|nr:hypothetical protein TEA_007154 [Camellia sinensis var. sinensis]